MIFFNTRSLECRRPDSLDKTAIGLQDLLDLAAEPSTGFGQNGLVQTGHYLSDLGIQECFGVVRVFVDIHVTNATQEVITRIAVRGAKG